MKIITYKNIAVAVLLLSSISNVQAQVPVLEFYKDGKVIYTDASQNGTTAERPVGNFEVLSADEHPVKNHIEATCKLESSLDTKSNWNLHFALTTDLRYGDRKIVMSISPSVSRPQGWNGYYGLDVEGFLVPVPNDSLLFEGVFPSLAKQTDYTVTFYEVAYGLTFKTDEIRLSTGYNAIDAYKENEGNWLIQHEGGKIFSVSKAVMTAFRETQKGNYSFTSSSFEAYAARILEDYDASQLVANSTAVNCDEGVLYVINTIPEGVFEKMAEYVASVDLVGEWVDSNGQPFFLRADSTAQKGVTSYERFEYNALAGTIYLYNGTRKTTVSVVIGDGKTLQGYRLVTRDAGGYEWVDLGLPSGTIWCASNLGAKSPYEIGTYFSWGEVNGAEVKMEEKMPIKGDYLYPTRPSTVKAFPKPSTWDLYGDKVVSFEEYWQCPANKQLKETRAQTNYNRYVNNDSVGMYKEYLAALEVYNEELKVYLAEVDAVNQRYSADSLAYENKWHELLAGKAKTWQTYRYQGKVETLPASNDAATCGINASWQMPTAEQFLELFSYCSWRWVEYDGSTPSGYVLTRNGKSIFLPVAHQLTAKDAEVAPATCYWSSSAAGEKTAIALKFDKSGALTCELERIIGTNIRPVIRR